MDRLGRTLASIIAGIMGLVVGFLFLMPSGCNDVGGVPSWERCTSPMGLPAFSVEDLGLDSVWNILVPLVVGLLFGWVTWLLIGVATNGDSTSDEG